MRYLLLLLLVAPVIGLALINLLTRYKLGQLSKSRFVTQLLLWLTILIVVSCSFPLYNYLNNRPILDSTDFSSFDIIQTTTLVWLIYVVNDQRQRLDKSERHMRDLHQELSIRLAIDYEKKKAR